MVASLMLLCIFSLQKKSEELFHKTLLKYFHECFFEDFPDFVKCIRNEYPSVSKIFKLEYNVFGIHLKDILQYCDSEEKFYFIMSFLRNGFCFRQSISLNKIVSYYSEPLFLQIFTEIKKRSCLSKMDLMVGDFDFVSRNFENIDDVYRLLDEGYEFVQLKNFYKFGEPLSCFKKRIWCPQQKRFIGKS